MIVFTWNVSFSQTWDTELALKGALVWLWEFLVVSCSAFSGFWKQHAVTLFLMTLYGSAVWDNLPTWWSTLH